MPAALRASLILGAVLAVAACKGAPPPGADFPKDSAELRADEALRARGVGDGAGPTESRAAADGTPRVQTASATPGPAPTPERLDGFDPAEPGAAAPPPPPIDDDPGQLVGLDREALQRLLGEPGFVRRDDPARMWRYRHESCVLDLFLYAESGEADGAFKVRHVEARAAGFKAASTRKCLRALLTVRRDGTTG